MDEGDAVHAGDLLARIDDEPYVHERARAEAQIVTATPDVEIVRRAGRLAPGMIGNLIGVEARRLVHGLRRLIEGGGEVLVGRGPGPAGHGAAEGGRGLDGQLIGRDVLEAHVDGPGQFGGPAVDGLVGPGIDQVDGQAGEGAGGDGDGKCRDFYDIRKDGKLLWQDTR